MQTISEVVEEVDEDLQLQSNFKLTTGELKILKNNGILFLPTDRIKSYAAEIRNYLQNTDITDRVWTMYKATDISNKRLGFYAIALTIDTNLLDKD